MTGFTRKTNRRRTRKVAVETLTSGERTLAALIRGVPIASAGIGVDGEFSVRLVEHSLAMSDDGMRYVATPTDPADDGYQMERRPRKWGRSAEQVLEEDEP